MFARFEPAPCADGDVHSPGPPVIADVLPDARVGVQVGGHDCPPHLFPSSHMAFSSLSSISWICVVTFGAGWTGTFRKDPCHGSRVNQGSTSALVLHSSTVACGPMTWLDCVMLADWDSHLETTTGPWPKFQTAVGGSVTDCTSHMMPPSTVLAGGMDGVATAYHQKLWPASSCHFRKAKAHSANSGVLRVQETGYPVSACWTRTGSALPVHGCHTYVQHGPGLCWGVHIACYAVLLPKWPEASTRLDTRLMDWTSQANGALCTGQMCHCTATLLPLVVSGTWSVHWSGWLGELGLVVLHLWRTGAWTHVTPHPEHDPWGLDATLGTGIHLFGTTATEECVAKLLSLGVRQNFFSPVATGPGRQWSWHK